MTSLEIIRRTLRREHPSRLAVRFPAFQCTDMGGVGMKRRADDDDSPENVDHWGCVWEKTEVHNMGQVKGCPLADISKLDAHPFPSLDEDWRFADMPAQLDELEAQGKYVFGEIFMVLFERMHSLHGFAETLTDIIVDRPAMDVLAGRVADVQIEFVRALHKRFGSRVHGIYMTDDWGTQRAAFVSMNLWRDFFQPHYSRIFDAMHDCGYDVWVHSCGRVNEIIEGYIESGVNAVNLQQPRALGIEEIGRRYRGRITLDSLADIQTTLPTGDRRKIEDDVDALIEHWASEEGGFVFCDYGDDAAIGVPDTQAKLWMYERFSYHSERLLGEPLPEPVLPKPNDNTV